jgi:hypothetical protein
MTLVTCIFCKTTTDPAQSAGYCEGCGRKLPTTSQFQTKRSMTRTVAEDAGLDAKRGGPRETLLLASIAHLFAGGLFLVVGPAVFSTIPHNFLPRVMTWTFLPTLFVGSLILVVGRFPRATIGAALVAAYFWVGATFFLDAEFATRWLPVQAILLAILHYALFMTFRPIR